MVTNKYSFGFALSLTGFMLLSGAAAAYIAFQHSQIDVRVVFWLLPTLFATSLAVVGLALLARANGRHAAWGSLGLLGALGLVAFMVLLRDRSVPPAA